MHGVGAAGLVGEPDRARAVEHDDLVARLRDLDGGQRGRGRRHVEQHFDALVVEHVAGDVGGEIGLVEMIGRDDLDLAAEHLAAEILHRHLRGHLAAGPGDVGVETGHVEDAAELERRLCLRQRRGGRHRQRCGENACDNPFHEGLPSAPHCLRLHSCCRDHAAWHPQRQGARRAWSHMRFSAKRNGDLGVRWLHPSRRHACAWLLRMRSTILMVRSAATPRVSNHAAHVRHPNNPFPGT